jgi:transposase-like protein
MDKDSFTCFESELEALTAHQRQTILERLQRMSTEDNNQRVIEERLNDAKQCPHCQAERIVKFGQTNGQQRYRCNDCRRTFIALTGTPFTYLHDKAKLLTHAACMAEGLSIAKSAKRTGLTIDRAFRWRHTFLAFLQQQKPSAMTGVVEADEMIFRRSYKGQRQSLPRPAKKRGGAAKKGTEGERVPVLVTIQRGSRIACDSVLERRTKRHISAALANILSPDAILSSDGNESYRYVARQLSIQAGHFVASEHGHGGRGIWHVQNVNAYDARLKNWLHRFRGVATKYLANYLGWRRLLDRCKDNVAPQHFLFHAIRSTYQQVI